MRRYLASSSLFYRLSLPMEEPFDLSVPYRRASQRLEGVLERQQKGASLKKEALAKALQRHRDLFLASVALPAHDPRLGKASLPPHIVNVDTLISLQGFFLPLAIQATLADSLQLLLDLGSLEEFGSKNSFPSLFSPRLFASFTARETLNAFQGILSEEQLLRCQVACLTHYAEVMKRTIQQIGEEISSQEEETQEALSKLRQILVHAQDLGVEVQAKLFFEIGVPLIAFIGQKRIQ